MLEATATGREGELVLLGVPDGAIVETVALLVRDHALRTGAWLAHLSGANGLEALAAAKALGTRTLALHPLQTFPDVESALARIPGCFMAVTADDEEGFSFGTRLVEATAANIARLGPQRALTGPAVRGDAGTVERNLDALSASAPRAIPAYVALARVALDLGTRGGRLTDEARARVEEVLGRWT